MSAVKFVRFIFPDFPIIPVYALCYHSDILMNNIECRQADFLNLISFLRNSIFPFSPTVDETTSEENYSSQASDTTISVPTNSPTKSTLAHNQGVRTPPIAHMTTREKYPLLSSYQRTNETPPPKKSAIQATVYPSPTRVTPSALVPFDSDETLDVEEYEYDDEYFTTTGKEFRNHHIQSKNHIVIVDLSDYCSNY